MMAFQRPVFAGFYGLLKNLQNSLPNEGAIAENFILEERLSDSRENRYSPYVGNPATSAAWNFTHEQFLDDNIYVERGIPETFGNDNRQNYLPHLEPDQYLLRMENLSALVKLAGEDTDLTSILEALDNLVSNPKDTSKLAVVEHFLYRLNDKRDFRPTFAGFWGEVGEILSDDPSSDDPEWPDKVRDCFGLGHFDPIADDPIPVLLFRYRLSEMAQLDPGKPNFASIPTCLDGGLSPFFYPTPVGWQKGQAVDLSPGSVDDYELYSEILHRRLAYRPEHVYRVGWVKNPPGKTCEEARHIHLTYLQNDLKYYGYL